MLTIKNYVKASSLQEAYELNQKKSNRVMGGMMWLRMGKANVDTIIDLSDLGLDKIEETDEEFSIGAMVTLRQLEKHEGLNAYSDNAICKAVKDIVGVQFRNSATVGGSIYGRFGFSDVLTVFLAMDTYVELFNAGIVPLKDYAKMNYDRDILVRVIVKKKAADFAYMAMRAQSTDFPVLTCAVSNVDGIYRASIGARPGRAVLVCDETGMLANGLNDESIETFSTYVAKNISTGSNIRGSEKYRKHLCGILTMRALAEINNKNNKYKEER